jgi:hypothetical protein
VIYIVIIHFFHIFFIEHIRDDVDFFNESTKKWFYLAKIAKCKKRKKSRLLSTVRAILSVVSESMLERL